MAKTKLKSFLLTTEEEQEINDYITDKIKSTGVNVSASDIFREAIFKFIRNGNSSPSVDTSVDDTQDNEQDTEQAPANTPAAFDFSGLDLD